MAKEIFDGEKMANTLNILEKYYDNYYSAMQKMDLAINTNLNVTANSVAYGKKGEELLKLWNDNCSVFKNYYYVFKELSSLITKVFQNNAEFEKTYQFDKETTVSYGEIELSNLNNLPLMNARQIAALMAGQLMVDGVLIKGQTLKDGREKIIIGDQEFIIEKDKNGNLISVTNVETGEVKTFVPGTMEEKIQTMFDKYNSGEISEEEWDKYCETLSTEEKGFLDCIMTNAFVVNVEDASSIIGEVNDSHYLALVSDEHTFKDFESEKDLLFKENLYETQVIADYDYSLTLDTMMAENLYNKGLISEEVYEAICEMNYEKSAQLDEQIMQRGFLNNALIDSRDKSSIYSLMIEAYENGDTEFINQQILLLNETTAGFSSLESILTEDSVFGSRVVVDLWANRDDFGIYEGAASVSQATSIKETTFIGAYDYATNTNQTYTDGDLVYFSTRDYIFASNVYTTSTQYAQNDYGFLEYIDKLTFDSIPDVQMDSVYIKSLDAYCTVLELEVYKENGILVIDNDGNVGLGDNND